MNQHHKTSLALAAWGALVWVAFSCAVGPAVAQAAEARVEFELVMAPGFSPVESQRWIDALKRLGLDGIRIRSSAPGDQLEIRPQPGGYLVIGALTREGTLRLPAGTFKQSDSEALLAWVAKLRAGGEEGLTAKKLAFGLLAKELVAVQENLATPVDFATKGELPLAVAERIAKTVRIDVRADAGAQKALADETPVADEFEGLASGTALAALVRPLGLVVVPAKDEGAEPHVLITSVRNATESWPIGWPLSEKPAEAVPALLNFLDVEIKDTPLREALGAIQLRLKVPFVYDYNSLARQKIDLATVKVSLPPGNSFYQRILDRLVHQALLRAELRSDDGNRPFFWITTQRQ